MDEQKQQLVEKLKAANNILVTVRNNPSVDLLSACIGLTLLLNKLNKHATAVFSGEIPSTMEFLKPEETLEKNTDSLRDFIIALDKSKADKLRYKVEDKSVRIFITPYRTSISQDDLDFSQGDFNVDVVVALGAHEQQELDQAITAHGRILHDATVTSINNANNGNLGTINWQDTTASSISELVTVLAKSLSTDKEKPLLDEQIATALLTGIVAETDRFSNSHTTSTTMSVSAELMSAGANQQLVATKLQEVAPEVTKPVAEQSTDGDQAAAPKTDDGTLEIAHEGTTDAASQAETAPAAEQGTDEPEATPPSTDEDPFNLNSALEVPSAGGDEHTLPQITPLHQHESMLQSPPDANPDGPGTPGLSFADGDLLTANTQPEPLDGPMESFMQPGTNVQPLLSHDYDGKDEKTESQPTAEAPEVSPAAPVISPLGDAELTVQATDTSQPEIPTPSVGENTNGSKTLSEIEQSVDSPHIEQAPGADIDTARDAVLKALQDTPATPEPIVALNAQPGLDITHETPQAAPTPPDAPAQITELHLDANGNLQLPSYPPAAVNEPAPNPLSPADQPLDMPLPPSLQMPTLQIMPPTNSPNQNPNSPPPVPPPMLPPMQ